ncbi:MAG: aspartate aminotransferase family protein [Actinobacteria bacterium]|nr:MAG: aspartate aminotransferase family protein [Actinomycetota bacterium]
MENKDLEVLQASYKQIRDWHEHVNPTLSWRLHSRGFNKKYAKAKDIYYYDDKGTEYLDFLGGFGLNCIGHNHPRIKQLINDFLESQSPVFMQAGILPGPGALAQKLYELTGLENCFFGNSGTEVVEGAIKLARKATGKHKVISCDGAFHGKSMGSLSVSGRKKYKEPFEPLVPGCIQVPYGNTEVIESELKKGEVACVALEPIQGEAGIIVPYEGYLKDVEQLCRKYDTLLFLDEIQSGMGRTGRMFAYQYEDVTPDILTLAKGLSGTTLPIGALISKASVYKKAYGSRKAATAHTSTFGGNNLSTLVGLTTIKIIEEDGLINNAKEQGDYLIKNLNNLKEKYPKFIKDVRGKGLMAGIEFKKQSGLTSKMGEVASKVIFDESLCSTVATLLLNKHQIVTVYTLNNSDVLRFEPALTIQKQHIDKLIYALESVFKLRFWGMQAHGGKIVAQSVLKK